LTAREDKLCQDSSHSHCYYGNGCSISFLVALLGMLHSRGCLLGSDCACLCGLLWGICFIFHMKMVEPTHLAKYAAQLDAAMVCTSAWIARLHDDSCVADEACVCNLLGNKIRINISSVLCLYFQSILVYPLCDQCMKNNSPAKPRSCLYFQSILVYPLCDQCLAKTRSCLYFQSILVYPLCDQCLAKTRSCLYFQSILVYPLCD
jgi:hypothetical protein